MAQLHRVTERLSVRILTDFATVSAPLMKVQLINQISAPHGAHVPKFKLEHLGCAVRDGRSEQKIQRKGNSGKYLRHSKFASTSVPPYGRWKTCQEVTLRLSIFDGT